MVDGEYALVQTVVHALQHGVVVGILARYGEIFLDAGDAAHVHILCNLHGVGAPWGHHLAAWTYIEPFHFWFLDEGGVAVKPAKFAGLFLIQLMVALCGNNVP